MVGLERRRERLEERAKKNIVKVLTARIDTLIEEVQRTNELLLEIRDILSTGERDD